MIEAHSNIGSLPSAWFAIMQLTELIQTLHASVNRYGAKQAACTPFLSLQAAFYGFKSSLHANLGDDEVDNRTHIVTNHITHRADDHDWANQFGPAFTDGQGCCCGRAANIGITSEHHFFNVEFEQFAHAHGDGQIDDGDHEHKHKQQWRFGHNQADRCRNADDHEEQVDAVSAQFLAATEFFKWFFENRHHNKGDGGEQQVFVGNQADEQIHHDVVAGAQNAF